MNISCITRALSKVGRVLKKASPEIAIVGGTVGLVVAGVIACKETPKAMAVVDDANHKREIIDTASEKGELVNGDAYTPDDYKHDRAIVLGQEALGLVKVYAPAMILATLSIASIFVGGKIFKQRLTTVTAAYGLLEQRFAKYRNGVIEKFGADMDKELRYGIKKELVEKKDDDGKTVVEEAATSTYNGYSDYARFFDETNPNWHKDGNWNLNFIRLQQEWATNKLIREGILFLNDVYRMLGFDRTPEGQLVGWVYDPSNKNIDSYVDFGLTPIIKNPDKMWDVINNHERSFLLDFNCDGRVLEKLKTVKQN